MPGIPEVGLTQISHVPQGHTHGERDRVPESSEADLLVQLPVWAEPGSAGSRLSELQLTFAVF